MLSFDEINDIAVYFKTYLVVQMYFEYLALEIETIIKWYLSGWKKVLTLLDLTIWLLLKHCHHFFMAYKQFKGSRKIKKFV
jgi:hypothetical protein